MLVRSGIILVKYWFSITDEEQQLRFLMRIHDPLKQWKLSPDGPAVAACAGKDYTKAKEEMLERTHIPEAPWWIVEARRQEAGAAQLHRSILSAGPLPGRSRTRTSPARPRLQPGLRAHGPARELYVPQVY